MLRRAQQAVYWPGIEGDLRHHRNCYDTCNIHTPSQPPEPLLFTLPPDYPFQQTVVDLLQLEGHDYVYADRLTGWLEVSHLPDGTESGRIKDVLRHHFSRWGAPEQLSMDGGTNLGSEEMKNFLQKWGVGVRVSSAHFPQSNRRAEVVVKSAKRILRGNIGADGSLDNDKISLALLQYLNTPLRDINRSPAQLAMGRQLQDGVPSVKWKLEVDNFWGRTLRQRECQMADHHDRVVADRNVTSSCASLAPGDRVLVQDHQHGRRWNRAGIVIEARDHRQYLVRLDGSGRISLRTRQHLRPAPEASDTEDLAPPTPLPPLSPPSPAPRMDGEGRRARRPPRWLKDYVQ
ncbi:uncharacterized protein LOC135110103 [Scylla paramamosain]|uniref:uncharacterized protein LOC135110103 n=1 Tax=Scylla paramamosain TaxID=85552 RepID=UPI0030827ECB